MFKRPRNHGNNSLTPLKQPPTVPSPSPPPLLLSRSLKCWPNDYTISEISSGFQNTTMWSLRPLLDHLKMAATATPPHLDSTPLLLPFGSYPLHHLPASTTPHLSSYCQRSGKDGGNFPEGTSGRQLGVLARDTVSAVGRSDNFSHDAQHCDSAWHRARFWCFLNRSRGTSLHGHHGPMNMSVGAKYAV
jgi:hypothetical protein